VSYQRKKQREQYHLGRVKKFFAEFPVGVISEHEEPDFLIQGEQHVVGIELVQYVRGYSESGSKLRWREELQDQVVRAAKQKFEAEFHTPLSVHFHWFHHRLLRGAYIDSLANAISKLISTHEPIELDDSICITPDDREQMSNFITRISIR
jgi:hypothetical protein